ncbi:MAG TPA: response regulator transcription factor [Thermoanaerobaculia bacterium]|nr:response regulator transcription factor [Thermoanaerobaculia bacterium]
MAVIDDDASFARRVRRLFEPHGCEVEWHTASPAAMAAVCQRTFDLLFIDVWTRADGLDLCRRIRSEALTGGVAIIAVTIDAAVHVEALSAGADQSVVKRASDREIVARAHAVLRRAANGLGETAAYADPTLRIFPETMRVLRSGEQIRLSKGESEVLALLIRHAPAALSVGRIRAELSGPGPVSRSAIEARLKSLRRKIGKEMITNRIGFGYSFSAPRQPGV